MQLKMGIVTGNNMAAIAEPPLTEYLIIAMETERLILMPLDCEMLDSLLDSDDAFLAKYGLINDGGEYLTPSAEYLLKEKQRLLDHPEVYPFAVDYLIVIKELKTVIGSIDFKYLPDEQGVTEIGYGMRPKYEGHGYMTEAVLAMIAFAKENGVKTIVADTLPDNAKSQRVLVRCGFTFSKKENGMLWFSMHS